MCRALRTEELDVAVALTEGVISDIVSVGPEIAIAATYVASPLHWQVSVGQSSAATSVDDLRGKSFGISRFGSGSHIMAHLLATERRWELPAELKFAVKGGLPDLLGGIADGSVDSFLWETFTCRPHSDVLRKVGEIVTPWPCFVIAVRRDLAQRHPAAMNRFLRTVCDACREFVQDAATPALVERECKLSPADALSWMAQTKFSPDGRVERAVLQSTMDTLLRTGVTTKEVDLKSLVIETITLLE